MFAGVAGGGAMDLVDLARRPFADVAPAISGSVVYMDAVSYTHLRAHET